MTRSISAVRVAILCGFLSGPMDAIGMYAQRLADALTSRESVEANTYALRGAAKWHSRAADRALVTEDYDVLMLQYNPFAFGRRGRADWLPAWWAARTSSEAVHILTAHELYVPGRRPRELALGVPQRIQARKLRSGTDAVITTCGERMLFLSGWDNLMPVDHVPVGTNVTPATPPVPVPTASHGPRLLAFGSSHPSRLFDHVIAAANQVALRFDGTELWHLGHDVPALPGLDPAVALYQPGALSEDVLSGRIAAADLVLLPYVNGVASNRTTLAAALAHGSAVLSTSSTNTDSFLRCPAIRLVAAADADVFAREAVKLLTQPGELAQMRRSASQLFESHLAWPVIAANTEAVVRRALQRRSGRTAPPVR